MNMYRLTAFYCLLMVCITAGTSHAALTQMGDYVYDDSAGAFGQVWVRDMDTFTNMNLYQQTLNVTTFAGAPSGMSIGTWRIASVGDFANLEAYGAPQVFDAFTGADWIASIGPSISLILGGRVIPDDPSTWGDYEFGVVRSEYTIHPYSVYYDFVNGLGFDLSAFTKPAFLSSTYSEATGIGVDQLFNAIGSEKKIHFIPTSGGSHGADALVSAVAEEYWVALKDFLESLD